MARRRELLRYGSLGLIAGLAGCAGGTQDTPTDAPETAEDGGGSTPTGTSASTPTEAPSPTEASTGDGGDGRPPGADVLGGPDDLRSDVSVRAAVLDSDQGAGTFVFTPSVVFVEQGATVSWSIEGASHSVTAYHQGNDRPHRVPEGAAAFDSGTVGAGTTFEHTFETPGVFNYFCLPHESLGMVGVVVVEGPQGGPGTAPPSELSGKPATNLETQLKNAGVLGAGDGDGRQYDWTTATFDAYWYSLYNMSTNIAMSGNGVLFPHNEQQQQAFEKRFPAILKAAGTDTPPVKNPNLNMAAFTEGNPSFTQKPVLSGDDGRPDASTLKWDMADSSKVVSPSSVAYTHLKGVTWAKNFQKHFDILPAGMKPRVRAQVLTTLAQIGTAATLVQGGPEGNGALTKNDDNLLLVSGFAPGTGEVVDPTPRPHHHAAMLWFLSDLRSLAENGWFGYVNPEPLIPAENIGKLTDGMGKTVMNAFAPGDVAARSTRDLGEMLAAVGWYGTHAGTADLQEKAAGYADALAGEVEGALAGNGKVENGSANQAATQGIVGQGLLWASEIDGVDHADTAGDVLGYLREELWDGDAGTFAPAADASTYEITARDAGDITGGLNAADAVLGAPGVKEQFARFFNNTFNRGRLQRAQRPPSRDTGAEHVLPLPPKAGGEFGQAAVYNGAVEYDPGADEWSVTDDRFYTADALYLANQDIWVGNWGGDFYQGRGVPGKSDTPP